ncbi:Lrp/AsnC family transcriptional regulator [Thermococcus sp.]|uniref:Lrp/AsnC family transcriptional regulator n=1 Tax=Thermococcus sp. TaxID=35749 RepID=UPI00262ED9FF|nr:Lrp/AsnC family transcriptional regulator [Thermococcus sp.]
MGEVNVEEIEFLVEILERHPLESLRKIAAKEGIDYYRLKRIYDKYYGKYMTVNAIYNLRRIGLKSFVAFLSVPAERLLEVGRRITQNPFVAYANPAFGFKNGLSLVLHIPKEQVKYIDEMLSKYSEDFEYYEVLAYSKGGKSRGEEWGEWNLSHDYAVLMDILKWDARTKVTEIARALGKARPTVRFMINRLKEKGVIVGFYVTIDMNIQDRGIVGLAKELDEEVLNRFNEYEINVGILPEYGYFLEWFFSSKEDLGSKVLEFSRFVDKILVEYFDPLFKEMNDRNSRTRFSRMVKEDGSGYRSILEF